MLQGTFLNLETTGFYGLACMSLTLGPPVESNMQFHAWNHMVPCHSIRESHTVSEVQNVESIRTKYLKKMNKNYSWRVWGKGYFEKRWNITGMCVNLFWLTWTTTEEWSPLEPVLHNKFVKHMKTKNRNRTTNKRSLKHSKLK